MKTKLLIIILFIAGLTSCKKGSSFLDATNVGLTADQVFADSVKTLGFLDGVYANVNFSFRKDRFSSHGNSDIATDDAEYRYSGIAQYAVILYNGSLSPNNVLWSPNSVDFYVEPYIQIRSVNLFLSKINSAPFSQATKTRLIGEARFLRAFYYSYLLRGYGGIILIGDQVFGKDDIINLPRNTYEECVNYIVNECDEAAKLLPVDQLSQDFGRATKGACLALKSRVLLTAASSLFNGGGIVNSGPLASLIGYPTYDASRWAKAAQAALDVINMNKYRLVVDNTTAPGYGFYSTFLNRTSPEIIYEFTEAPNRDFEGSYNPPSRSGAYNVQPTQNLVDDFDMINGKSIKDATSGYDPANPYVNRDPRLGYTVTWNGANYANNSGSQAPVYTYVNAPSDGYGIGTNTGYYARKMCDVNISYGNGGLTQRGYALIRYAEILLNYAEASNEAGQTASAIATLTQIRARAGIQPGADNLYGIPAGINQSDLRLFIQKERHIEMAFEDMRFYDIRRWKIAMTLGNGFNNTMKITPKGAITPLGTAYTYQVVPTIRMHVFFPANYLMPFPQSEILKAPLMLQNPGY